MPSPATQQEPFAYCYGNSEYGFGKIIIELRNYLMNAFGDAYMGDIPELQGQLQPRRTAPD